MIHAPDGKPSEIPARRNVRVQRREGGCQVLQVPAAAVEQAKARVEREQTTREVMQVPAPVDGTILHVNARTPEFISTFGGHGRILMGSLRPPHVRVNIGQQIDPDSAAVIESWPDLPAEVRKPFSARELSAVRSPMLVYKSQII